MSRLRGVRAAAWRQSRPGFRPHAEPSLDGDEDWATVLYDQVVRSCPLVLHYEPTLRTIAHDIDSFTPKEKVRGWLETLKVSSSSLLLQAYGQLLLLWHCRQPDDWSEIHVQNSIASTADASTRRGTGLFTARHSEEIAEPGNSLGA